MKKQKHKILSIFLGVILVLSMTFSIKPMTVLAEESSEADLYVGGIAMYDGDYLANYADKTTTKKPSGGYAYYKDGVLTLHDYVYSGIGYEVRETYYEGIRSEKDLTIYLEGNNVIDFTSNDGKSRYAISSDLNMITINGSADATLTVESEVCMEAEYVTIDGGIINLDASRDAIYTDNCTYINGGDITINAERVGINCIAVYLRGGNTNINAECGIACVATFYMHDGNLKIDSTETAIEVDRYIHFYGGNTVVRKTATDNGCILLDTGYGVENGMDIDENLVAVASENVDGTAAVSYNKADHDKYNYFWVAPPGAKEPFKPIEPETPEDIVKPEEPTEPENPTNPENTTKPEVLVIPAVDVSYRTHIQTYGWEGKEDDLSTWKKNGAMSGTSGEAKRLEGISIVVNSAEKGKTADIGIAYTTHCQTYGWLPWSANGEMNGTEGEAKRLEAIKIQLTGKDANNYDVYYRVHAQSYGWLGWAKNGAPAGTSGYAKRLEGIQIVVVKKNETFDKKMGNITSAKDEAYIALPGSSPVVGAEATDATNPVIPGIDVTNVSYKTHVQSYGWQGWKYNGAMSGTSGEAKRLEGINIKLTNKKYSGGIAYTTHVQTYGWQGEVDKPSTWKKDGEMSGTQGETKRLEAICITLTGEMANHYDVYYRVHAQTYGWLGWAKNGAPSGTAGYAKRLEGIQVVLVPKGGAAPANNYGGVTSANENAYIAK